MTTKAIYLMVMLTFFTKIYAQNNPDAIKDLNFRSAEYVELNQSQEIAFEKYLIQLNKDNIYRRVTTETCTRYKNGTLNFDEEENTDLPLQVVYKKAINFNDNFLVKFELDNCVGGSAYYRDFAFFTKANNNEITYNKTLTNELKDKFYQFVISKFNEGDRLCYSNEHNYTFTDGLNITKVKDKIVYGKYVLYGLNAPNCCPEYNGEFEYNITTRKIQFKDEQYKSAFDGEEMNDDEIQILDWTPPPFEEQTKLEKEPIPFKNSNIKLNNEQKEALKQFVAICKINVNIEDSWSPKNSLLIINALEIEGNSVPREKTKSQLDKVLIDENLRRTFLYNISKMSGGNEGYTYFFIKSFSVPNIVSMKPKDIEVLSKFINNNYKYIKEMPIQSNSDTQNEKPIIYTATEKEAVFNGGNSKLNQYISQNLNVPESAQYFSGKVIVNFVVNENGSVSNVEIKQTIPIELKNEIEKLFKNMPNWTPAKSQGKNVKMKKTMPIQF